MVPLLFSLHLKVFIAEKAVNNSCRPSLGFCWVKKEEKTYYFYYLYYTARQLFGFDYVLFEQVG